MKTFKSICIGCGEKIQFEYYELGDIIEEEDLSFDYEITEQDEVGWRDFDCPHCGRRVDYYLIENVVEGNLAGFSCCVETGEQVRNLIKAVMYRVPAVVAEIRHELEEEKSWPR